MPLAANTKLDESYPGRSFSYPVAAGFHVFSGGQVGVNAQGAVQPAGSAGVVAVIGVCQTEHDNTAGLDAGPTNVWRGTWAIPVAAATPANIGAPVYAVDDASSTTASGGGALQAGVLAAITQGRTWVRF